MQPRAAGILLHPSSLPGPFGIGDFGPRAEQFFDWARDAGQGWWQILPLGPPDGHGAPYSALSAFAGNPLLISPELLERQGLVDRADLETSPPSATEQVDLPTVQRWKEALLRASWKRFRQHASISEKQRLERFVEHPENAWIDDWTLFAAIRRRRPLQAWWKWESPLKLREPGALEEARQAERDEIDFQQFVQWQFFDQWDRLRGKARERGIRILGDLPIYVSLDSAEVWARPELFELDGDRRPLAVAGCPPDAYSETGQLWGNPLYRWDRMRADGYAWWTARLEANLRTCDLLRLDHFRGFAGYWSVSAGEQTAQNGTWITGPGIDLFDTWRERFGDLPLIAEDLGVITPDVVELRHAAGLPGIKVLQFAFDEVGSDHLPHHHERHSAVYTGTHDNDTVVGWYRTLEPATKDRLHAYAGIDGREPHWDLIRLAYTSVADLAIVPVQDVLGLDTGARMNTPASTDGNWIWRLRADELDSGAAHRLRMLAEISGRLPAH